MTVSVRSYLTAGVVAVAASAIAVAPMHAPAPEAISSQMIRLSAAVQPLFQPVNAAAAVVGAVPPAVTINPALKPAGASTKAAAAISPAAAAVTNSAGTTIMNVYNAV